jgi:hypothetical protein
VTNELPTSRNVVALHRKVTNELPLVGLWLLCIERVTYELFTSRTVAALRRKGDLRASTSRNVVALRRGHLALLVGRLAEFSTSLSSDTHFGEQARRLYRQSGVATPLKVIKSLVRLFLKLRRNRVIGLYSPGWQLKSKLAGQVHMTG